MRRVAVLSVLAACLTLFGASARAAAPSVFVTNSGAASVSQFDIGAQGLLSAMATPLVSAGANPLRVAVSPDNRSAYVTNSGTGAASTVSQYDVGTDGALTPKSPPTVATGIYAVGVIVNPDGGSAYVTNSDISNQTVSQYDVAADGTLTPKSPATVPAGNGAQGLAMTPDGRSLYATNGSPGNISQYDVDPATGKLTAKTPATVSSFGSPSGIVVTPDGRSAYVANAGAAHVTQYDIDPATGKLSPKTPDNVASGTTPNGVALTPDGSSLYVTNYSAGPPSTVSQYSVDPSTGKLTPKSPATVPAGVNAGGIAVSADGTSAYVANRADNNVSQYDITAGGLLAAKTPATAPAGMAATGIAVANQPEPPDTLEPDTTITKAPKNKLKTRKKKAKAKFEFTSSEAGSTFQCSLDGGAFEPCASPFTEKLKAKRKARRHEFEVRAVDAAGNVDPTPAGDDFKVKRKR